jgi:hypothetical protein
MSMKRFLTLTALTTVACLTLGDRAHATYTITPTIVSPAVNPPFLTFGVSPLTNSPIPTPSLGTQYQWMTVKVDNSSTPTILESVNYDVKFSVVDNTTLATSSFEIFGTLVLQLASGAGSVQNTFTAPIPTGFLLGAIPFTITPPPALAFTGVTLSGGSSGTASFSLILTAVPEPASVVMMGLGVVMAGSLGYVHRRRMLAQRGE